MTDIPPESPSGRSHPASVWDALREPFGELPALLQRMAHRTDLVLGRTGHGWEPLTERAENDEAYVLRVELPGIAQEKVHVEVVGRELSISGEVTEQERGEGVLAHRVGRFAHHAPLPPDAAPDRLTASLARGVLTVTVPKEPTGTRRTVHVTEDPSTD
jgi:HSP20 family protein